MNGIRVLASSLRDACTPKLQGLPWSPVGLLTLFFTPSPRTDRSASASSAT